MKISASGSVRLDLLGGTLDLNPIHLILPKVVTLNVATSLKASVVLEAYDQNAIAIYSKDYDREYFFRKEDFTQEKLRTSDLFGPMTFICQILDYFNIHEGLRVTLESGSPAGAGLGGSSSMGITLYKALCDWCVKALDREKAIRTVQSIEARILDSGPAGYQDYYPALYGGILALHPGAETVWVEQLYCEKLKLILESRLTLAYTGMTRNSGINNWEVYKRFFDKDPVVRTGLEKIAELSFAAYRLLIEKKYDSFIDLISEEGSYRKSLFAQINTEQVNRTLHAIKKELPSVGLKACGAGGGGCYLFTHSMENAEKVRQRIVESGMEVLDFQICPPVEEVVIDH